MVRCLLRDWVIVACTTAALITPVRGDSGSSAESGASRRGFVTHTNYDLEGGDLSRFQGATQDACERSCSETDDCVAYSYDKWNRWCFLKNGLGLMRFEPKCVIGLLKDAGEPKRATTAIIMQRYRSKEFPGDGYARRKGRSMEACEEICRKDTACVAYTFIKREEACKLLDDAPEYHSDDAADSGVKRQPEGG